MFSTTFDVLILAAPSWTSPSLRAVSVRHGRHHHYTSTGHHGDGTTSGRSHFAPNHSAPCRPGTIIRSDEWAAYRRVQQLPFVSTHATVNHSLEFVNPVTGVTPNTWSPIGTRLRQNFKRMKGVHDTMLSSYLMWRERHGQTGSTAMNSLFRDIAQRCPV